MNRGLGLLLAGVCGFASVPAAAQTAPLNPVAADAAAGDACTRLTTLRIPDLRVERGERIAASADSPRTVEGVPVRTPFCRVSAVVEGEINFDLWLPEPSVWTGRFFGIGNGGLAGFIRYPDLARGMARGLAAMSTDTGHRNTQAGWGRDRARAVENYAHRGVHLATVNAKRIVAAFYGRGAAHSYFAGCSGGGMQGVNEAARYPADYDGIVVGAHGVSFASVQATMLLLSQDSYARRPDAFLGAGDWQAVNAAAVKACGDRAGIIREPGKCRFDPASTPGLSPAKIATARRVMTTLADARGDIVYDGMSPGAGRVGPSSAEARELYGMWLHRDADWKLDSLDPLTDIPALEQAVPGINLVDASLVQFERRGGKMLAFQGTRDTFVPAAATIRYHATVAERMGAARANAFDRLFLLPGVAHCQGGGVPDQVGVVGEPAIVDREHDLVSAVIAWVEDGQAPDHIMPSRTLPDGTIETQRVDAYPLAGAVRRR